MTNDQNSGASRLRYVRSSSCIHFSNDVYLLDELPLAPFATCLLSLALGAPAFCSAAVMMALVEATAFQTTVPTLRSSNPTSPHPVSLKRIRVFHNIISNEWVFIGPFVTTVGGTTGINPETAVSFSGGGFSNYFAQPSYQSSAVSTFLTALGSTNSGLFK